jgi:hypothetical protein
VLFVDSGFGATVDPLRGLLVTRDVGLRFERYQSHTQNPRQLALFDDDGKGPPRIRALSARGDKLGVLLEDREQIWLSRRGDAKFELPATAHGTTNIIDGAGKALGQVLARLEMSHLGGWPIELAVTRGARLTPEVALYMHAGRLFWISLSSGSILGYVETPVSRNQACRGVISTHERYFFCHDELTSSVYRFNGSGDLDRLAEWASVRQLESATDYGVIVRGVCAPQRPKESSLDRQYCAVSKGGQSQSFGIPSAIKVNLSVPLLTRENAVVVVTFPSQGDSGSLQFVGARAQSVPLRWPFRENAKQARDLAFFLRDLSLEGSTIFGYAALGDKIAGISIDLGGQVSIGKWVTGARAAVTAGSYALLPDSSGYAYESFDAGRHWQRTRLFVDVPNTELKIPSGLEQRGCSSVGCVLGDELYLREMAAARDPRTALTTIAPLDAPQTIRLAPQRKALANITCDVLDAPLRVTAHSTLTPSRSRKSESQSASHNEPRAPKFEGTSFLSFYGREPKTLGPREIGFDRGFQNGRFQGRMYARLVRDAVGPKAFLEGAFLDAMFAEKRWATEPLREKFDSIETIARYFADPRYGEQAVPLRTVFDVEGLAGLVTFEDLGQKRSYLVAPGAAMEPLGELPEHEPNRLSDFVALQDGAYLLGGEPIAALFELRGGTARIIHNYDPRKLFRSARLQLARDPSGQHLAYLVASESPKSNRLAYYVYPITLPSGHIEVPMVIDSDAPLRSCESAEDGWLFERSLAEVAQLQGSQAGVDMGASGRVLLLGNEQGWCVRRVLLIGQAKAGSLRANAKRAIADIDAQYLDGEGALRSLSCSIVR